MNVLIYDEAETREEVIENNQFIIDKLAALFPDKEIITYYLPLNTKTIENDVTQFIQDFRFQVNETKNVETPEGKDVNIQYGNTLPYYYGDAVIFTHVKSPDYMSALCDITACGAASLLDVENQKAAEFEISIHELSVDEFQASSIVYNVPDSTKEDFETLQNCFFSTNDHSGIYPNEAGFKSRIAYEVLLRDYIIHGRDCILSGIPETIHTLPTYLFFDYSILTNEELEYFKGYQPNTFGFSIMKFIDSAPTELTRKLIGLNAAFDSKYGSIGCKIPRSVLCLTGYPEPGDDEALDHMTEKLDDIDKSLVSYILINPTVEEYEHIKSYVREAEFGFTEMRTTPGEYSEDLPDADTFADGTREYDGSTPMLFQFTPGYKVTEYDEYMFDRLNDLCLVIDARMKGEDEDE